MGMRDVLAELASRRIHEYLFQSPISGPVPRLYPPASEEQIAELCAYAGQDLEQTYREFLSLTDGMDEFDVDMRILGCRDRVEEGPEQTALQFLEILRESGTPVDVGLPEDVQLFPVAIDGDVARGIYTFSIPDVLSERFWWVGEGDSMFFGAFADMLGYVIDPGSYSPRERID